MTQQIINLLETIKETKDEITSLKNRIQFKKGNLSQYEKALERLRNPLSEESAFVKHKPKQKKIQLTQGNLYQVNKGDFVYIKDCDEQNLNLKVLMVGAVDHDLENTDYPLAVFPESIEDDVTWITIDEVYLVDEDFDPELD